MSSNDWPEHQEQLGRAEQSRQIVNRALAMIVAEQNVSRAVAIRLMMDVARMQRRPASAFAADVVRTGRLPQV